MSERQTAAAPEGECGDGGSGSGKADQALLLFKSLQANIRSGSAKPSGRQVVADPAPLPPRQASALSNVPRETLEQQCSSASELLRRMGARQQELQARVAALEAERAEWQATQATSAALVAQLRGRVAELEADNTALAGLCEREARKARETAQRAQLATVLRDRLASATAGLQQAQQQLDELALRNIDAVLGGDTAVVDAGLRHLFAGLRKAWELRAAQQAADRARWNEHLFALERQLSELPGGGGKGR